MVSKAKKKEQVVAGLVVRRNKDGKILVIKRVDGRWDLPKGHRDPGESTFKAATRETYEETGLRPDVDKAGVVSFIKKSGKELTFYPATIKKSVVRLDPNEHTNYRWVSRSKAIKLLARSKILQRAVARLAEDAPVGWSDSEVMMASNDAQMEATMSGMVGPYMTPLARTPLALIRRKPVRSVSGAVCPHCGRGMVESCCPSCKKGGPCEGSKKRKKQVVSENKEEIAKAMFDSWPKTRRGPKKKINGKEARGVLIAWLTAYGYKRDYRATKDVWINASETKRVTFKRAVVVFEKGKRGEWERNYKVMRHGEPLSTIKTATSLYNTVKKSLGEGAGAVPNCTPLQPPDPNCTLTRGWKDEMKRKLKKFKKRSPRRRL
jgi:8-oxo-dGTP pyrophosphatase MutT (NUDIX family)